MYNRINYILLMALLIIYAFISNLIPIFQWDESRLAVNALEMLDSNNFIVTTYEGYADNWNSKPPLAIWLMGISVSIFGYSELALRLPSIIFSVFTLLFLLILFRREKLFSPIFGVFFIIILPSSIGFSGYHIAITADYDAILVFFNSMLCISLFFATEHLKQNTSKFNRYLYLSILAFALGFFTKSIAIGFCLPAILLYLIFQKQIVIFLNSITAKVYLLLFSSIFIIIGYYLLRDFYSPGYIQAVLNNEITGRYKEGIENHIEPFYFYFNNIFTGRFSIWIYFIFLTPIIYFKKFNTDLRFKRLSTFLLLNITFYLIIISSAKTKLQWYDAALYPLIATQILIVLNVLFNYVHLKKYRIYFYILLALFSVFSIYGIYNYYTDLMKLNVWPHEKNSALLKHSINKNYNKPIVVLEEGYQSHIDCYLLLYNSDSILVQKSNYGQFKVDTFKCYITSNEYIFNIISRFYKINVLEKSEFGYVFNVREINTDAVNVYINTEKAKILQNKEWMEDIVKKSKQNNILVEKQLVLDAIYISEISNKFINNSLKEYILAKY